MPLKALIFDVDGTLAETEELHRRAYNRVFEQLDLDWRWDQELYRHLLEVTGGKERIAAYMDENGYLDDDPLRQQIDNIHAIKNRHYAEYVASGALELRPGVKRLMCEAIAADIPLAIATATSNINVQVLLKNSFCDGIVAQIKIIVSSDMVKRKKPAPDVYNQVIQNLGVSPQECIAFEDSYSGLKSAMAAGIPTLTTPAVYTTHHDFTGAVGVVSDLGEPDLPYTHIAGLGEGDGHVSIEMLQKNA